MRIVTTRNKIIAFFLGIIAMIAFLLLIPGHGSFGLTTLWYRSITLYLFLLLIVQIFVLRMILPKNRSLIYLVIILCFIFHFSQVILYGFDYEFDKTVAYVSIFRFYSTQVPAATIYTIKGLIGIFLGIIAYHLFEINRNNSGNNEVKDKYFTSLTFARVLVCVGLIFDIGLNIYNFYLSKVGGYISTSSALIPYPIRLCSYLLLPGTLIMIARDSFTKSKRQSILILFVLYKLATMITGYRAYALINIIIILYAYYRLYMKQRISLKYLVYGLILFQIGGAILVGVRNTRVEGVNIARILEYLFDVRSNLLINLFSELGTTLNVICVQVANLDLRGSGGTQIFYAFTSIIPGVSRIFSDVNFNSMNLEDVLDIHRFGGSYIADILFDFGVSGIIVSGIFLGLFFAWLYEKYERAIQEKDSYIVAIMAPIIVEFLYTVRSSIAKMPRMIVWYLLLFYALKLLTTQKRNRTGDASTDGIKQEG